MPVSVGAKGAVVSAGVVGTTAGSMVGSASVGVAMAGSPVSSSAAMTEVSPSWTSSPRTPVAPAPVTATTTTVAPVAACARALADRNLARRAGKIMANLLRRTRALRDGSGPAATAVRVDGLDWSVSRPVASSSASAAFGRPGWVALARTAPVKAARPAASSGTARPTSRASKALSAARSSAGVVISPPSSPEGPGGVRARTDFFRSVLDPVPERAQSASLEGFHGSHRTTHDVGDLLDGQVGEDAQQEDGP